MMIRSENTEVNRRFAELLTKRNDLRIGQMIVNSIQSQDLELRLFYIEDEGLIELIEKMLGED